MSKSVTVKEAFEDLQKKYMELLEKVNQFSDDRKHLEKRFETMEKNNKLLRGEFEEHMDYFSCFLDNMGYDDMDEQENDESQEEVSFDYTDNNTGKQVKGYSVYNDKGEEVRKTYIHEKTDLNESVSDLSQKFKKEK